MAAFKVLDVRVGRKTDGTVTAYIKWLGQGTLVAAGTEPNRAAIMLSVFDTGRDCYWDDATRVFQTTLGTWNAGPSPISQGRVDSWDVRIPEAVTQPLDLYLSLVSDAQVQQSSGSTAVGWARLSLDPNAQLVLGLLRSRYCYYSQNGLRNTQILQDINWTAP